MVIPASVDIPPSDWSQLSPELQEQGQEEGEPTPGNRTMGPDRPTMVQKAYEDRSRTKAACELVQAGIMSLAQRVRTEKYETFLHILHSRKSKYTTDDSGEYGFYFCLFWEDDTNSSCWIVHL